MFFNFKRGDIVDARGDIAVIYDVLRSESTSSVVVFIRFIRNVGQSAGYDTLHISPEKPFGVDKWELATQADLDDAIARRKKWLDGEFEIALWVASEQHG